MSFLQEEIDMNDSEARRRELLRQTRRLIMRQAEARL